MEKIQLALSSLEIPMRVSFKHASAERNVSESLWVEAQRGHCVGFGEGCPRKYVTGETLERALIWAQSISAEVSRKVSTLEDLKNFVIAQKSEIDLNPSAWCAIELAILDLFAKEQGQSLEKLLNIAESRSRFQYTAVLSADDAQKYRANVKKYLSYGFYDFKLKVLADKAQDWARIQELKDCVSPEFRLLWPPTRLVASMYAGRSPLKFRLRLDGNNAWAGREDEMDSFLNGSPLKPWAIEEPFAAKDFTKMSALSVRHNLGIILDESLCYAADVDEASSLPGRWIANVRVSKMGGLLRSLEVLERIKAANWSVIVGAQVGETSVLSRAALVLARAAGSLLTAQEGAFGTLLLEKDIVAPELRFGLAGIVSNGASRDKGLGLIKEERVKGV
jgi:L-alanine-DL-glutamate epimerase-like enolase superfamily enzyme